MSSQPLALAIRLAAEHKTEDEAPSVKPVLVDNSVASSGKAVKSGRGNLQFWLRDMKIAESLCIINRSAKHLVDFTNQLIGHFGPTSTNMPIPIMSDGDVVFMTQLTGDITRGVGEISTARYHGMGARKRKERHQEVEHQAQDGPPQSVSFKRLKRSRVVVGCQRCGRTDTPEWRTGPDGYKSLCNVCGLVYAKQKGKGTNLLRR